jgi:DNA polymerase-3 subunit gamma/tau
VHAHFLAFCRDALHLALGEDGEALALPAEERKALAAIARQAGYENLLRLLHHLLGSESAVRRSEAGALALEIAWLRAAELPRLVAIEKYLAGTAVSTPRSAPESRESPKPARLAAASPRPAAAPAPPPIALVEPVAPQPPKPDAGSAPTDAPPAATTGVAAFIEKLVLRRPTLAALFEDPATLAWNDGERTLVVRPVSDFAASSLNRNREIISSAAVAAFGEGVQVRFAPPEARAGSAGSPGSDAGAPPVSARAAAHTAERRTQVTEHPRVQAVLEIFGGGVAQVESPAPTDENIDDEPSPSEDPFR